MFVYKRLRFFEKRLRVSENRGYVINVIDVISKKCVVENICNHNLLYNNIYYILLYSKINIQTKKRKNAIVCL